MKSKKLIYIYIVKTISLLVLLLFNRFIVYAQSNLENKEYVKWVRQYPSDNKENNQDFKAKLNQFIFGKNEINLIKPISLLVNDNSEVWVTDQGSGKVISFVDGKIETPNFLEKALIDYTSLVGICNFSESKMLFTDSSRDKIYVIDLEAKKVRVLNDELFLNQPTGIAYSEDRNEIWVVETGSHRLAVLNEKGELIKKVGLRGENPVEFNYPTFLWIDNLGRVYIVDSMNFRVQVLDENGEVLSVFGENGDATGYITRPKGIATDSQGNIYLVDALFHTVQIFDIRGNFLYNFGSQGQGQGQLWMPTGIWIDKNDMIYVADSYNSRIQVFKLEKN